MEKIWVYKDAPEEKKTQEILPLVANNKIVATLLLQRGYDTEEKIKNFLSPNISHLHDPFLMKDMHKAVCRIEQSILHDENILVYGDYDVDGTTAVFLVYKFLHSYHQKLSFYIPNRHLEGYGISEKGIMWASENGIKLIIALDCGIKSVDKVSLANSLGIDIIICDHHIPDDVLPNAIAILNPKQSECPYPYKELTGCGIGLKLVHAFSLKNDIYEGEVLQHLYAVAISICADIVPITGENRVITALGIEQIQNNPPTAIRMLKKVLGLEHKKINVTDIVFGISPIINAPGRISNADIIIKLLLSDDEEECFQFAKEMNAENKERRSIEKIMSGEAISLIENDATLQAAHSTVLFQEHWNKGVVGIVASRCIEKYYRPTIILTESNGKLVGSGRSIKDFDLYNAIEECKDFLQQFGGHSHAAGLTLEKQHFHSFAKKFEEIVQRNKKPYLLFPKVEIDMVIPFHDNFLSLFQNLSQMAPFGPSNMRPTFASTFVQAKNVTLLKNAHIKMFITQARETNVGYNAIAFGMLHVYEAIRSGAYFHIAYSFEKSDFSPHIPIELHIKDIKID
ncbi:MAG: single-stranded-DNA-specific exonuclease RecJ [Chitinophagaceae bacterium]|nr:single-stranded-DNA-specific exonuclease RecJ [Chitinophagaceae bacterium]